MEAKPQDPSVSSSTDSAAGSAVPKGKSGVKIVEDVRGKILKAVAEYNGLWSSVYDKYKLICRLRSEEINVSAAFSRFAGISHTIEERIPMDIINFHRYIEIGEQIQLLIPFLGDFKVKLARSEKIVGEMFRESKAHIKLVKETVDEIVASQKFDGLVLPRADWVAKFPDPQVEMVADEWRLLGLDDQLKHCLKQVEEIVRVSGRVALDGEL